jgi:hypothetical protein
MMMRSVFILVTVLRNLIFSVAVLNKQDMGYRGITLSDPYRWSLPAAILICCELGSTYVVSSGCCS